MNNKLFNDFNNVSSKQWKQKIQFDLKGNDYNTTLVWKTNDDILVKPFYHADDFNEHPAPSNTKASQWKICQSIFVANENKSNLKAINAIEKGAESLFFTIPSKNTNIENLLKNINTTTINIHFTPLFISETFTKKITRSGFKITIHNDIINNLTQTGNWFESLNSDFNKLKTIVKSTNTITVNAMLYQNAGATMVQQLAYTLAHANEYLNSLENNDQQLSKLKTVFKISIGTNYFFEIAKLKALRKLWSLLASEYKLDPKCHIIATPTQRNKTIFDYNTNLLRTTTEYMSAILGGANTICCLPYDSVYHKDNTFSQRIARNQLLILKHESYFDKVDNPTDGAYYIESITQQLAEKALSLFKDIETNGGFLKQLKEGTIQRKIKESANKEQQQFDNGDEILLGTNKYPNTNECLKNELEIFPFIKTNIRKTLIQPIISKRLAEQLEQQRLKNET